jgi:uncharacterized oligopeptide transporter (OPT) family protein
MREFFRFIAEYLDEPRRISIAVNLFLACWFSVAWFRETYLHSLVVSTDSSISGFIAVGLTINSVRILLMTPRTSNPNVRPQPPSDL